MDPSPTALPPGVAALAHRMGLGQLADQAQAVLDRQPEPGDQLALMRAELAALRADLEPLLQLAQQLGPLLSMPKVQRALAKQQA